MIISNPPLIVMGGLDDRVLEMARLLAIKDGIVLTGFFSRVPTWPESGIKNNLEKQSRKNRRRTKRKYRKMKRFLVKKYDIENPKPIQISDTVKYHYINKAEKILKSEK
jgi:hypothetical protein